MVLTPLVVAIGLVIGMLRGGRFEAILETRIRMIPLLVLGVLLQTIGETFDMPGRVVIVALGLLCLAVGASRNIHIAGAAVAGIGVTLNLAVLLANGYIPVRFESLTAFGNQVAINPAAAQSGLWQLEADDTTLGFLGDIVPVPVLGTVISFGDCVMLAGLMVLAMNIVLQGRTVGIDVDDLFGGAFDDRDQGIDLGASTGIPPGAALIETDDLLGSEAVGANETGLFEEPPVQIVPIGNGIQLRDEGIDLRDEGIDLRGEHTGPSWEEAIGRLDAGLADTGHERTDLDHTDLDHTDLDHTDLDHTGLEHTGEVRRALFDEVTDGEGRRD